MKKINTYIEDNNGNMLYDGDIVLVKVFGDKEFSMGKIKFDCGHWVIKGKDFTLDLRKHRKDCYKVEDGNESVEDQLFELKDQFIFAHIKYSEEDFSYPFPHRRRFAQIKERYVYYLNAFNPETLRG